MPIHLQAIVLKLLRWFAWNWGMVHPHQVLSTYVDLTLVLAYFKEHFTYMKIYVWHLNHLRERTILSCSSFVYLISLLPTGLNICFGVSMGVANEPGSSVGIATGWAAGIRFPARERDVSPLHTVQTDSEAHPVSYPMGSGGLFPRMGHEADHSPRSSAEVKNGGVIPPLPTRLHDTVLN
jgi:hypothetical protein